MPQQAPLKDLKANNIAYSLSVTNVKMWLEMFPTVADVLEIKSIFSWSTPLPLDIIGLIIDEAEIWPCAVTQQEYGMRGARVVSSMTPPVHYDTHGCLALTPQLSKMVKEDLFTVKRVKFIIRSCDQGWASELSSSPYGGSWTWFDAKIARPLPVPAEGGRSSGTTPEEHHIKHDLELGETRYSQTVKNPYETRRRDTQPGVENGDVHVRDGRGDTWTINRNMRASGTLRTHTVSWRWDEPFDDVAETIRKLDEEGVGQGAGFVRALTKDDRIAVVARARFPGWVNTVQSISIFVYYSV